MAKNLNKKYRENKTSKKYIPFILLVITFLIVFTLKALFYGFISGGIFSGKIFDLVPDYIYYLLSPIYYIFIFPFLWLEYNIPTSSRSIVEIVNNDFIAFTIDILLTIIWMTFLFFAFRFIWRLIFKRKFT